MNVKLAVTHIPLNLQWCNNKPQVQADITALFLNSPSFRSWGWKSTTSTTSCQEYTALKWRNRGEREKILGAASSMSQHDVFLLLKCHFDAFFFPHHNSTELFYCYIGVRGQNFSTRCCLYMLNVAFLEKLLELWFPTFCTRQSDQMMSTRTPYRSLWFQTFTQYIKLTN